MNRCEIKDNWNTFDDAQQPVPTSGEQKLIDDHMEFLTNMEHRMQKAFRAHESEMWQYHRWMREQIAKHFFKHGREFAERRVYP